MNTEKFLNSFENIKYRYIGDNAQAITKGKSDERRTEWNGAENKNGEFFTVNGFTGGQTKEFLDTINAFFIDIDYPKDISKKEKKVRITQLWQDMDGSEFIPTFIIESKNGFHCYWVLTNKIHKSEVSNDEWQEAIKRYEGITESLIKHWGGDPSAKDITRVLRVPGSTHWKNANEPFEVSLWSEGETYEWGIIEKKFPPRISETTTKSSKEFPSAIAQELERLYPRISRPSALALLNPNGDHIKRGTRNTSLHIASTILRDSGKTLDEALALFPEYHGIVSERGLRALRNTIRSAYSGSYAYGMHHELVAPHVTAEERDKIKQICRKAFKDKKETDHIRYSMFEREILSKYPNVRKDYAGRWYVYKDGVYELQSDEYMQGIVMDLMDEAELYDHKTRSKVLDKLACFSALLPKGFEPDKDKDIINVKNGLLNIRTMALSPHTPEYVSVSKLDLAYEPKAECTRWSKFIDEVTQGDKTQSTILKQFTGYCLTDTAKYKTALMLVGGGDNGKSVFSATIMKLLGDRNVSTYSIDQLNSPFGLAGIYGKKLNVIEEVSEDYYRSDNIKKIISGERISANIKMKQDSLDFISTVKMLFCVNQLPKLADTSEGAFNRFVIVNFGQRFVDTAKHGEIQGALPMDISLRETLQKELSGILLWAIDGLVDLEKCGHFSVAERNREYLERYKNENSGVREFIAEMCEVDHNASFEDRDNLYLEYAQFVSSAGGKPKGRSGFVKELGVLGFETKLHKKVKGNRTYIVCGLRGVSFKNQGALSDSVTAPYGQYIQVLSTPLTKTGKRGAVTT